MPENKLGEERLGSDDIFANFGITFVLSILIFMLLSGLVLTIIFISRSCNLSEKNKQRKEGLKMKIFYNPWIRFTFLAALKANLASLLALKN